MLCGNLSVVVSEAHTCCIDNVKNCINILFL